ncbi:MAG: HD domain-containing protein [Desulfomonilaceae bacterium]|nr:HD domain-containing protein [Desulfomonilaceae bacterium]
MTLWSNPRVRTVLELVVLRAEDSYVVGGAVRDNLMGLDRGTDIDLAVQGDGYAVARDIADALGPGAAFVPLDRTRGTGRLVLTEGDAVTIDVSAFKGSDIVEDLTRRDFTINALAVKMRDLLQFGMTVPIDPLGGVADIKEKRIRACSNDSFRDDPIRILRAFRFSASLGFEVTSETASMIPPCVESLVNVAGERIRDEFVAVLSCGSSVTALRAMESYGVLAAVLPELRPMKGCGQNEYHHLDVWGHTLEAIERLEWIVAHRSTLFGDVTDTVTSYLFEEPVVGRPRVALLKLVILFHDSGKPRTRTSDATGRVRFFGHEKVSRDLFLDAGRRMKLSKRELEIVGGMIEGHMRPTILTDDSVSKRAVYRLCRKFDRDLPGLFLVYLSDLSASRGPARPKGERERAFERAREVLTWYMGLKKRRVPLVNGHDLMSTFGIAPGPYVGKLLRQLAELRDRDKITTREQALAAAKMLIEKDDKP